MRFGAGAARSPFFGEFEGIIRIMIKARINEIKAGLSVIGERYIERPRMKGISIVNHGDGIGEFSIGGLSWGQGYGDDGLFRAHSARLGIDALLTLDYRPESGWFVRVEREGRERDDAVGFADPISAVSACAAWLARPSDDAVSDEDEETRAFKAMIARQFGESVKMRRMRPGGGFQLDTPFMHDDGDHFAIYVNRNDKGEWEITDDGDCDWHYIGMRQGNVPESLMREIISEAAQIYSVELRGDILVAVAAEGDEGFRDAFADLIQTMKRISTAGWTLAKARGD